MKPAHLRGAIMAVLLVIAMFAGQPAGLVRANPEAPSNVEVVFTVNEREDFADFNVGDGICDSRPLSPGEQCSLRAAIQEANATVAEDTVKLDVPGPYLLDLTGPSESNSVSGDLDIIHDLVLEGNGAVIDAGALHDRVFTILAGATVVMQNLTVRNGQASVGGGVLVDVGSKLYLTLVTVRDNYAGDKAGGIYNAKGLLHLRRSTVSANYGTQGGGIVNEGTMVLVESTVSGNEAVSGGGVYVDSADSTTLSDTTVSGNLATDGGGIYVENGAVILRNATVTNNNAADGSGGGIFGSVTLNNTIVAGNLGSKPDCAGALVSQGYNLLGNDAGCSGLTHDLNGDQAGTSGAPIDPLLGPLQDNGGWTATHALLPGSPALDSGNPAMPAHVGVVCFLTDQRNARRPGGARCDVGAYEAIAPILVTNKADLKDAFLDDGVCEAKVFNSPVGCTLRAAIQTSNSIHGLHVISLPAGVYTLTLQGPKEDESQTGDLDIEGLLVLRGAGSENTQIVAGAGWKDRLLDTDDFVLIEGVTLSGGACCGETLGDLITSFGGGILNHGRLRLRDVVVSGNSAGMSGGGIYNQSGMSGGGVYNQSGILALERTTVSGNSAISGGGVYNDGPLITVDASTISGNFASVNGGGLSATYGLISIDHSSVRNNNAGGIGSGGGLNIAAGIVEIGDSIVSGNHAGTAGGGIAAAGSDIFALYRSSVSGNDAKLGGGLHLELIPSASVRSSTLSGNQALESGGGLYILPGMNLTLNNVTVTDNTADSDASGSGDGGGIFNQDGVTLSNSILAGNEDKGAEAPECQGTILTQGHNLVQSPAGCTFSPGEGDLTGQDPKLGPLQQNGGFNDTLTHALLVDSPAIDAGHPALVSGADGHCEPNDQRHSSRTDGDGDGTVRCDMGAYETGPSKLSQTITFDALSSKLVTDPAFGLAGKALASSGLPVSFTAAGVCTVSGTTVVLNGQAGGCTITAHQPGDTTYSAAADVARSFSVNQPGAAKQSQTITFDVLEAKNVDDPPFSLAGKASASSALAVTFTAAGVCSVSGVTVTLSSAPGSCAITAHQPGNDDYFAAADVARSFSVLAPVAPVSHPMLLPLVVR